MRILLLCTDAYGGHGGIALFNRELIATLASYPGCEEVVVLPRLIVRNLEPIPPGVRFTATAARGKAAYLAAVMAARRVAPSLVICGHVNLLPIARLITRTPLLIMHGVEAWKPLRDPVSNRIVGDCRGIVSVSELTRDRFLRWSRFSGRTWVLPNAVHAERYGIRPRNEALKRRFGLDGRPMILTLGRIEMAERYKGFDELLEAMPRLLEVQRDLVYVIAGSGSDVPRLQQKTRHLGLTEHVVFTDFVPESEKPDLYNLADVYVMPSRGEGFGFVFLEAMASGVPVIASKHDGGREALLHGRLGLLVDPSSPAEIRSAILETLARHEPRSVPPGLEFFSFENFERRVHGIIRELIDERVAE